MNEMVQTLKKALDDNEKQDDELHCQLDDLSYEMAQVNAKIEELERVHTRLENELHPLKTLYPEEFTNKE